MGATRVLIGSCLLGFMLSLVSGCVVAPPNEGYYDRDHHRWYHEHTWVACEDRDEHCR